LDDNVICLSSFVFSLTTFLIRERLQFGLGVRFRYGLFMVRHGVRVKVQFKLMFVWIRKLYALSFCPITMLIAEMLCMKQSRSGNHQPIRIVLIIELVVNRIRRCSSSVLLVRDLPISVPAAELL